MINQNIWLMMTRLIKRRLLKAKMTLNQTIQKILDINRNRKKLPYFEDATLRRKNLELELKILNKLAEQQVTLIKRYENALASKSLEKTVATTEGNLSTK